MRILIIGYGSIGRRHHDVLRSLFQNATIDIASVHRETAEYRTFDDVRNPTVYDYFVIASETGAHLDQLKKLEAMVCNKIILVEKPLFSEYHDFQSTHNRVYVGYNLRFHPLIEKLRQLAVNHRFTTVNIVVGQYLPDWRIGVDYRASYSASRERGGGVLLDLSHEIDYVQWLFGPIGSIRAKGGKISPLEIESEDFTAFIGKTGQGVMTTVSLDYLSRIPIRRIYANSDDSTCICDLVDGTMRIRSQGMDSEEVFQTTIERNGTYAAMHADILMHGGGNACTIKEGLEIMQTIGRIRVSMEDSTE